jgi:hypothetical protein
VELPEEKKAAGGGCLCLCGGNHKFKNYKI